MSTYSPSLPSRSHKMCISQYASPNREPAKRQSQNPAAPTPAVKARLLVEAAQYFCHGRE